LICYYPACVFFLLLFVLHYSIRTHRDLIQELKVKHQAVNERFGEQYLQLEDPDGLLLNFTVSNTPDGRKPWTTKEMNDNVATVYLS